MSLFDRRPSRLLSAAITGGTVVAALLGGASASPTPQHPGLERWYRRLDKPGFTPPQAVFPIAWTTIQAALAFGGYRILRAEPSSARTAALGLWAGNQAGIAGWSETFFGQRSPGLGTLASAALGAGAIGYVATAAKVDRRAAAAGVPLVAWVAFATVLAGVIWRRND